LRNFNALGSFIIHNAFDFLTISYGFGILWKLDQTNKLTMFLIFTNAKSSISLCSYLISLTSRIIDKRLFEFFTFSSTENLIFMIWITGSASCISFQKMCVTHLSYRKRNWNRSSSVEMIVMTFQPQVSMLSSSCCSIGEDSDAHSQVYDILGITASIRNFPTFQ
jgi:hypothetical protein